MTWFKVDDGLHAHRKAVRAGVPAMGLWVLCGSWAADQLTDGWVPCYIAERLDADYQAHAADLVRVGLWEPGEYDGESGWWFHDWGEQQPSRVQVLAERKAAAERQRRARDRAKSRRDAQRESHGSHGVTHGVTHASVTPLVTVPPTRPDPTRPDVPTEHQRGGEPPNTQTLVGEWIDHCRKRPPGNVVGQVSKQIKALLAEGVDATDVRAGLIAWHGKGLHPSALPSVVNEVMNCPAQRASPGTGLARRGGPPLSTADERFAQAMALAAKYAEEDG